MKTTLPFILALSLCAFAAEKYGIYDLQGKLVSTFEAESHELPEKARQIKGDNPHKKLYVSSAQKGKSSKPVSRYRYKTETGAYLEASRKETFSVCPDKEVQGTWISEYSVALDEKNCLSVQAPNLAGTFRILFLQNSGKTDTIQVLVDQSYIQMGDYSHKIWVTDLKYERCNNDVCIIGPWMPGLEGDKDPGRYESRNYSQPLIVDKTKLTMRDAQYYSKIGKMELSPFDLEKYPKYEKLEESKLPFIGDRYEEWRLANERSKKDGLDTVYCRVGSHNENAKNLILQDGGFAIDTSASGYRSPFDEEWFFLMRAGASTRYYWGDNNDLPTVSRYEWVNPIGLKPVAQKLPNGFGLYDMAGIADEFALNKRNACSNNLSPECNFIKRIGGQEEYIEPSGEVCELKSGEKEWKCTAKKSEVKTQRANYTGFRLLRKTPKLHKLVKF